MKHFSTFLLDKSAAADISYSNKKTARKSTKETDEPKNCRLEEKYHFRLILLHTSVTGSFQELESAVGCHVKHIKKKALKTRFTKSGTFDRAMNDTSEFGIVLYHRFKISSLQYCCRLKSQIIWGFFWNESSLQEKVKNGSITMILKNRADRKVPQYWIVDFLYP